MMVRVITEKGALRLRTEYADVQRVKQVPGRRWNATRREWMAPATPHVAGAVAEIFAPDELDADAGFYALLEQVAEQQAAQQHKTAEGLPQPKIRKTDAWRHQLQAYHFAANMPAVLLDMGMGTGKSKVTIDLIVNKGWRRVLIACPKSVLNVWRDEVAKHADADSLRIWNGTKGTCSQRAAEIERFLIDCQKLNRAAIVVVNHEAAWREDMEQTLFGADFDAVIIDESHRIKSPSGKASRFFSRLGDKVPNKLCLTGTPTPHSPLDIYAQYRFLDKGIFGTSFAMFRARYAVMGGFGGKQVMGYQNAEELRQRVDSIAYHVGREVLDLPESVHNTRVVELTPRTMRAYMQMEKEMVVQIEQGEITANNALAKLLRLQQITSGYLPMENGESTVQVGTEKRDALADIFEDLPQREPIVVFARFRHDLDNIRSAAEDSGRTYAELSGRANDLELWQQGGADVIGVQIQAGGVGISLVRARYCVYYSVGFSLGDYEQSLARVHRPGQKQSVIYYHLIASGTVDEKVYAALQKRRDVIDEIFQNIKK